MGVRVLVVEDEQIVAADLEANLTRMGHEVVAIAASGEEAIRMADQHRPELVLLDVRLQGRMDGLQAGSLIHAKAGIPIIFITAFAGVFVIDPEKMQPPGICLSKPFSRSQLQMALDTVLAKPS